MPLYEFKCKKGHKAEKALSIDARDSAQRCKCGSVQERLPSTFTHTFKWTPGQSYTGVYKLDHGKFATHDLTPKGKFERLVKEGVCSDPFAEHADAQRRGDAPTYNGPQVTL